MLPEGGGWGVRTRDAPRRSSACAKEKGWYLEFDGFRELALLPHDVSIALLDGLTSRVG